MHAIEYEDKEVIQKSIELLVEDEYITFCTVGRTWGSSPRPAGSIMVISQTGLIFGSVSGGCIEGDLLDKCENGFFQQGSVNKLIYDGADTATDAVHIPCDSVLEIIVEKITSSEQLLVIAESLSRGEAISRELSIGGASSVIKTDINKQSDFFYDGNSLRKVYGPKWRILLVGANQVSEYVAALGKMLGYNVIVCEPRESYRESWDNNGCEMTRLMPDEAVSYYAKDFYTVVLSLSHDPKLDDMALLNALEMDLFYVGVIGSIKNNEARKIRLKELGLSQHSIAKLHGPVGLNIGSKVPSEIAISIYAEIISLRNNLNTSHEH
jgi:xanthine dehydrogenase accessory factor